MFGQFLWPIFFAGLQRFMNLPILYSFRRCPYAIRARLAILVSGLRCELREVSLANKPEAMLIASPKATIPVMVLSNGQVLDESLDIMRHALSVRDPEGWLSGVTDETSILVTINDQTFKRHLDHYKYPDRWDDDPLAHRAAGLAILAELDARLARHGMLTGQTYTLSDIAILPFVRQFAAVDESWFAAQPIPHLQKWLVGFLESKLFARAMVPMPIWKVGDPPIDFPPLV
jgi:glutathione S-transferase